MDVTVVYTLCLICSLTEAQLQQQPDPDSNSYLKPAGSHVEAGNPSEHQQTCTQEINAVLREMSASLAGLKVEVKYLQKENEAKTRELELQKQQDQANKKELELLKQQDQANEKELELQKRELDKLKQHDQANKKELELQKRELDKLKQQDQAHEGELITIKASANITENQVEALRREGEGFFIAPVRGVYHFVFHIKGYGDASHPTAAVLFKNGEKTFIAYEHQPSHFASTANSVTLLLEVGDVVFLRQRENTRIHDSGNHHTTFSGHLIFTM